MYNKFKTKNVVFFAFPMETWVKLQLTTDMKSDTRSWAEGGDNDGFEVDWEAWTEFKLASECSETFIETKASSNNWTRHHEDDGFLHDREFECVTAYIAKESLTKDVSFPFRILTAQRKQPHKSFSSCCCCCCSLFVTNTVCRQPDASFSR